MIPVLTPDRGLDDVTARFLKALESSPFQGEIKADYPTRLLSATDNSVYQVMPQAVVYPVCAEDLNVVAELGAKEEFRSLSFAPRGGGTGTNGQSLNRGVVVDTSKHLNNILDFDADKQLVTIQPGVVLDQLNAFLKERGFFFPPAVSTSSRATLGGMTGTDASGKGSRIYGKTSDYIEEMDVVLSGGQTWTSKPLSADEMKEVMERDDIIGDIHRQTYTSIVENEELIEQTFPKMNRGLTGYNLQHALDNNGTFNLSYLLAGSEGSLCFTQKLTFRVIPLPSHKGLVTVRYSTFNQALEGVQLILQADPAAVEVVDDKIMTMAQQDIIWTQVGDMLGGEEGEPPVMGMNFVEFVGNSKDEVDAQIKKLEKLLDDALELDGQATGWRATSDGAQISALWEMRKKSVGLLGALQGKRRALPFVEDTAVPPGNLAPYIREFRELLDGHGVDYGMFGHADVGCLHVRPTLDLTDVMDEPKLREISDGVADLTKKYDGLLWGEHGKGFRGEYSPKFFGPELYDELRKIKSAFDPHNLFNPGKIATPYTMPEVELIAIDEAQLRGQVDRTLDEDLKAAYPKATLCNGNGACFTWDAFDPMCPSYKATRDRVQSPKGRAGLLREWLRLRSIVEKDGSGEGKDFSQDVYEAMKTCLSCKTCATQCPVKVDIPEMKAQFLEAYHERYDRPKRDELVAKLEELAPLTQKFAGLTNFFQSLGPVKSVMKNGFGLVDLPKVSSSTVASGLQQRDAPAFDLDAMKALRLDEKAKSVILVQDTFTTHYDVDVVLAHYDLLVGLGYQVFVAPYRPNGKPLHVKGFLKEFDQLAADNDGYYAKLAETEIDMVGIEAAVTLMFRQEYNQRLDNRPDYTIHQFHEWLHDKLSSGKVTVPEVSTSQSYTLFAHCTEKTSLPQTPSQWNDIFTAFNQSLSLEKTGCCGMAGMFGHEAENEAMSKKLYDMSWKDKAVKAGADRMLVTGFSCRCQTKRYGDFKPRHPVEVLVELLK
ncbi:FAD-binding and (Fe-S)-binding domain-containing protein [Terasakiella sp. SH-1]|uniref:FAD-binding and (Fe-S)-binding domain-containing protein n=1 Tax=Terasakiella sp. SH-1 TaxID=2560057 RepID=UPI0010733CDE|nr:FAD-binding and (Fe-S)-binding domain-containing protein [Terasakiella sp. SH-1]